MINLLSKYFITLVSLATVIGQTQAAIAQNISAREASDAKVENIAKGITVRITTHSFSGSGNYQPIASGVLIKKDDKTYFVLTNKHVVQNENDEYYAVINISDSDDSNALKPETRRVILNPQGKSCDPKNCQLDIALLAFEKPEKYREEYKFAVLGDSTKLEKNARISVGGYPKEQDGIFRVAPLTFIGTENKFLIYRPINLKNGNCQPTDNTITICNAEEGMSGGPILNDQGELIGIHEGTPNTNTDKNQGIPINTILNFFEGIIPKETLIANDEKPKGSELLPISENSLIPSAILLNQTPSNQPFTKLFRPPVMGAF